LARSRCIIVYLKSSKTDITRESQSLTIVHTLFPLCAIAAMQEPPHGSLFYFQSGRYVPRGIVYDLLKDSARVAGLPYQRQKRHSFFIGAASVAAAASLPAWLVKFLSCWSSVCYQLYIKTPQSTLESVAPRM
ncbi:unnamed protein product, partial [Porites lobata]